MKSCLQDLRRAIGGRWFAIAVFATALTLWLGMEDIAYAIVRGASRGGQVPWLEGAPLALGSGMSALALPALSAMPFSAAAFVELKSGAYRMACFRAGKGPYRLGKTAACLFGAMLVQLLAFLAYVMVLYAFFLRSRGRMAEGTESYLAAQAQSFPDLQAWAALLPQLWARMLSAGLWACLGAGMALLMQASVAAYIGPLAVSFSLTFLSSRFFTALPGLDPNRWAAPGGAPLWALAAACAMGALAFYAALGREMKQHA